MNENMADEINLIDYIQVLRKRKWLIILGTLFCMFVAGVVSLLMPKIYRGEATFKITAKEGMTAKEIMTAKEMVGIIGNLDKEKREQILRTNHSSINSVKVSALRDSPDKFQLVVEAKRIDDIPVAISEFAEYVNNNPLVKVIPQLRVF
jgi:LPS O-antigen subunit length determinant protein (WzzB/FepE family)